MPACPSAAHRRTALSAILALTVICGTNRAGAEDFLPPQLAFKPAVRLAAANRIEVSFNSAPGYYLYREKFKFVSGSPAVALAAAQFPAGQRKNDEMFGDVEVFTDRLSIDLPLATRPAGSTPLRLQVTYQGCAEAGICYPPQTREFALHLPASANGGR